MTTLLRKFALLICLFAVSVSIPVAPLWAAEVDFSCVSSKVKGKIQVSAHHKEYDIVLENHCPGSVYWSMCIERMDPQTSKIVETLTPSGQVKVDKKTRVNLRMMRVSEESDPQLEFEEFYLDVGYALEPTLNAQCVASGCEEQKSDLRKAFRANEKARQKLETALADRIATECPQSGWSGNDQAECEAAIRQPAQAELNDLAEKQKELETKLAAVDPENCQVNKGE